MCHAIILLNDSGWPAGAREPYIDERGNIRFKRCPSVRSIWSAEDGREICVGCLTPKKEGVD